MSGATLRGRLGTGETGQSVLMPGVWDALSGLLAAEAGFTTVFLSGYCVSGTLLGLPDFGYLTQIEMAEVARRVCAANPGLDVVVDADTGYGNPLNTIRTVDLWRQAGASGIFIEDQVWPKRCGHMAGKQVVERTDWLAKLRAAEDHADGLHVTARTDARAAVGLVEAIERGKAARDVGVDAVFVEAPESVAEMEQIAAALPGATLVANMVEGVQKPYEKQLEIQGVGYQASLNGQTLSLQVGYANTIKLQVPQVVKCELPSPTQIKLQSIDKHAVGQFAANIRRVRPVEPYKGKGIRYQGEQIKRKAGKAFASG